MALANVTKNTTTIWSKILVSNHEENETLNFTTSKIQNFTDTGSDELNLVEKITVSLMFITMIVILTGNLLVITAVISFSALRDVSGIFIANLAVADLLTGIGIPFQIVFFFYPTLERVKHACILRYTVITFACNASIFSLACTVVDRFISIRFPLTYTRIMTEKRAYLMVSIIWTADFAYCLLPTVGLNNFDEFPICLYELVISPGFRRVSCLIGIVFGVFMFVVYLRIFMIVREHVRRIQAEVPQHGSQQVAHRTQSYVITALVVLFFQISWLPFFAIELSMYDASDVTDVKVVVASFSVFLGILNSTVNPVIYASKNRQYRRAFAKILRLNLTDDFETSTFVTS